MSSIMIGRSEGKSVRAKPTPKCARCTPTLGDQVLFAFLAGNNWRELTNFFPNLHRTRLLPLRQGQM